MDNINKFDVIIIGGSYAGLSAAMALGRSLRNVLIIDSGKACNRYTPHSHNFITQDGIRPADIAQKAKHQVLQYDSITFYEGIAVAGKKTANGFSITTANKELFEAQKLIFASGVRDIFADIEGFEACWGKTAIHCPYCHGYEFKLKKTAIIAHCDRAFHLAALVHNLTDKLSLIIADPNNLEAAQMATLKENNIPVINKAVQAFKHENGNIHAITFDDNTTENFEAVYAQVPFEQHCTVPMSLGCELTEMGHIKVDAFQKTSVPGVFACGDNVSMMRSVANAVATGNLAGAMVNNELSMERF